MRQRGSRLGRLIRAEAAEEAYAANANAKTLINWVGAWDRVGRCLSPALDEPQARALAQRVAVAHLHAYRYLGGTGHSEAAVSLFERLCAGGADDDIAFAATADLATLRFQQYLDLGDTRLLTLSVEAHEDVLRRCAAGQLPAAVVAMESGRGMLLNEALPPDERLRVERAALYKRYQQAAAAFAERSAAPSLASRPVPL